MRRHSQIFVTTAPIGWVGCCLFCGVVAAALAAEPPSGAGAPGLSVGGFDRAALQKELSVPLQSLEKQPNEALRDYVERLGDLHFALELAVDVSPPERRALSEQILTRVGQVGLLIRQRMAEPHALTTGRGLPAPAPGPLPRSDLAWVLLDNSGLLLRLLGGLLVAFALGYLVHERRSARATGPVARNGRGKESAAPVPVPAETPREARHMTLEEIRRALASGCTVLLQMGYEISPSRRRRFLGLAREAQEILRDIEGQTYTVWEDPGHPNRFYELLVCRRLEVLDQLASAHGPLPKLAEEIETCRVPSGFTLHRAWLGALPEAHGVPQIGGIAGDRLIG